MFKLWVKKTVSKLLASDLPMPSFFVDVLLSIYMRVQDTRLVRIFYVGASMKQYWPEKGGYLGLHITNFGDEQQRSILRLFKACEGLPVTITFKPHNYEGFAWHKFLTTVKTKIKWELKEWNDNFNDILIGCDFVVMSHWSTAIQEASLCGKPQIVMDWHNSKDLAPYTKFNTTVVRNEAELKREILSLVGEVSNE